MATYVEREVLPRSTVMRRSILSRDRLFQIVFVVLFLGVWQFVGKREGDFFLAPPTSVVGAAGDAISSGEIWDAASSTAVGIVAGFAIAAIVGVAVGTLMGTYRAAATTLNRQVRAPSLLAEAFLALGERPEAHRIAHMALRREAHNKKAWAVLQATSEAHDESCEIE